MFYLYMCTRSTWYTVHMYLADIVVAIPAVDLAVEAVVRAVARV
jgi:hypothetical protein